MNQESNPPARLTRTRSLACGVAAGILVGAAVILVLLFLFARGDMPTLTEDALRTAMADWDANGPANYRLQVRVSGNQTGLIELEVRDGLPISMTRDGYTPPKHTWDYWTVPEQFLAIERELTGDPQTMFGVPDRSAVMLAARFDPQYGYPRLYQRHVLGKSLEIGWEVTKFEPLP